MGSANLIRGRVQPGRAAAGRVVLETASGALVHGVDAGRRAAGEGVLSVRTVHLRLSREAPPGDANVWPARIRRRVFQGDFTQYHVEWDDRVLVVRSAAADPFAEGEGVYVAVEPRHCVLLEPDAAPGPSAS